MTPKTLHRTLLIKDRLRKWRRAELLDAENRVAQAQQTVDDKEAQRTTTAALLTRSGDFSAHELVLAAEQLEVAQRALHAAKAELGERIEERDQRKEVAGEATREVKAIEVLHERLLKEQRRAADLREQAELDERATRKSKLGRIL
jgi:flagellar biosynthesis chaperone FliJ